MRFIEGQRLYGQGIGWVDAHLLASTLLTGCAIWTLDKPLREPRLFWTSWRKSSIEDQNPPLERV